MNDDPDIAIIGAGIAGAALAWHLAPHAPQFSGSAAASARLTRTR
jgi:glycine/D-amino acid oxidase-like deaminating enzyme